MVGFNRSFQRTHVGRWFGVCLIVLGLSAGVSRAAAPDETVLDSAALLAMEHQADAAKPKEQCILYAQVAHSIAEAAGRQLQDGEEQQAATTLQHLEAVSKKMEQLLLKDAKQLKNAEMLMEHTTRRLKDMLHLASADNRLKLQATLERLKVEHDAMLNEVFAE